jgi:tetratricopeptide (TPR) repeat protein
MTAHWIIVAVTATAAFAQAPVGPNAPIPAQAHAGTAIRLMQELRFAEADREFALAVAADPENDDLRVRYATCLFAEERNVDARREFEALVRRGGSRAGLEFYLGLLDLRQNDNASAIRRLQPLASDTTFPKAPYYLGLALLATGRQAQAIENLERAAKSLPHDPEVHYRLARLYNTAGRSSDAEREFAAYRSALDEQRVLEEVRPKCLDALRHGPIEQARSICQLIGDPHDARRQTALGRTYAEAGDFTDAVAPLREAIRLDPSSFETWYALAGSLYATRQFAEALPAARKAVDLNPGYFDALNLLARTLYSMGAYQAALPVLEQAHELNPNDPDVTGVLERLRAALKSQSR